MAQSHGDFKLVCKLYSSTPSNLTEVAELLKNGQLAALPSETVYGLAGHALNIQAVRQIFQVKGRPLIDPLIVHVLDLNQGESLAYFDQRARKLAQIFWPGPLTMILRRKEIVPDLVTAGLPTVAMRVPAHPVFREVLRTSGLALAAPSANPFGYISPTRAEHVVQTLGDCCLAIVDGGPCQHGVESTIIDVTQAQLRILRPGPLSAQTIAEAMGEEVHYYKKNHPADESKPQLASGMLEKHYSPRKLAFLVKDFSQALAGDAIVFCTRPSAIELEKCQRLRHLDVYWLSESGSVQDMMHQLYDLLYRLDGGPAKQLWLEKPRSSLEGHEALLDRLTRACAKSH